MVWRGGWEGWLGAWLEGWQRRVRGMVATRTDWEGWFGGVAENIGWLLWLSIVIGGVVRCCGHRKKLVVDWVIGKMYHWKGNGRGNIEGI